MSGLPRSPVTGAGVVGAVSATPASARRRKIESRFAEVNGLSMHYLIAGSGGSPVILLHGYAQNSHMWRPLMKELGRTHLVIAPDLRGFGDTTKAESGYEKKTMAQDIHALANALGIEKAGVAGHDIGLMVAYAYAAQYPATVERIALLDAFIPGVGDTTNLFLLKDLWHFHFYGPTPLALVKGRDTCTLQVSSKDADRIGLAHGGSARVTSRVGSIVAPVEITDDLMPGVVSLPHGWGHDDPASRLRVANAHPGVNANVLTDDRAYDVASGTAVLFGTPVRIEAA